MEIGIVTKNKDERLNRSIGGDIGIFFFLALFGAFSGLPLLFAIISAFKPLDELFLFPPRFFVKRPTLENITQLFQLASNLWVPFSRYLFNTIFVTVVGTIGHVVIASLAAYPLSKHNFPGKKLLNKTIILALLFSFNITSIPQFVIMANLKIINSYLALILPSFQMALGLFLMTSFMQQIPVERLESARIDGAGEYRIFWRVVMPSVKPAWLTLIIFSFQSLWGQTGGTFIFDESLKMIPTALQQIVSAGLARAGVGSAALLLMMIPPIVLFILVQNSVIDTMTHSGIKG